MIYPFQQLDRDGVDSEIVAPDLFHQLGVVHPFYEQATGPGRASPGGTGRHEPEAVRAEGGAGWFPPRSRSQQRHPRPVDNEVSSL